MSRVYVLSLIWPVLAIVLSQQSLAQSAPGGVSGSLSFWLRADAGVTQSGGLVSNWQSQNSGNQVSESNSARQPSLNSNALNFNPGLSFDGSDDRLFTNSGFASHTQISVFNPANTVSTSLPVQVVYAHSLATLNSNAGLGIGNLNLVSSSFPVSNLFSSTDVNVNSGGEYIGYLSSTLFSTDDPYLVTLRQDVANSLETIRVWGATNIPSIRNPSQYGVFTDQGFAIGQRFGDNFRLSYEGDVMELISYSTSISNLDLAKIESYLAIKYGIALSQSLGRDYIDSSGNVIYNARGTKTDFTFNIAGIGRDDASALNQKQSKSNSLDSVQNVTAGLISMGLGTIAQDNASNTNTFSQDLSFLVWGHNNASTEYSESLIHNGAALTRMGRVWAVEETNSVGAVTIRVQDPAFNVANLQLVIGNNANLDSPTSVHPLASDANGGFTVSIDFNDGDFFSFAQPSPVSDQDCDLLYPIAAANGSIATVCL